MSEKKDAFATIEKREELEKEYLSGKTQRALAEIFDCSPASIVRELGRGFTGQLDKNFRREYSPQIAQEYYEKIRPYKSLKIKQMQEKELLEQLQEVDKESKER